MHSVPLQSKTTSYYYPRHPPPDPTGFVFDVFQIIRQFHGEKSKWHPRKLSFELEQSYERSMYEFHVQVSRVSRPYMFGGAG